MARPCSPRHPTPTSYTNDIVNEAIKQLKTENVDVNGSSFAPVTVTLTEGGA